MKKSLGYLLRHKPEIFLCISSGYISNILHKKYFNRFTLMTFIVIIDISVVVKELTKIAQKNYRLAE